MKIIIKKNILENILNSLQAFLEKKDSTLITSHILIKAENDTLIIKATDYEIGIELETKNLIIEQNGITTVNGKSILDIIRILKDEDINITKTENEILIKQANSNFKLPCFNYKEFPEFPNIDNKSKIEIESLKLTEAFKKVSYAIDNNNPKYELNGAYLDISEESINVVGTDTRRLAIFNIKNKSEKNINIIIPKKAILEIQKTFFNNIEIFYDETFLILKEKNKYFYTKLINGSYPDYKKIIPKETKNNIKLPKLLIIEAIKQINTVSNEMKIKFDKKSINFESISENNLEAKTKINIETNFEEEYIIGLNSRYLLDFLSVINEGEFLFSANDNNSPFFVSSNDFKTIIMPIMI